MKANLGVGSLCCKDNPARLARQQTTSAILIITNHLFSLFQSLRCEVATHPNLVQTTLAKKGKAEQSKAKK
jgi:hypothetical protein